MKGLIYRELQLMKNNNRSIAVTYVLCLIVSTLIILAFDHGNLASLEPETKDMLFRSTRLWCSVLSSAIPVMGFCMGHNEVFSADYKTKWMQFSYTTPISDEKRALASYIVRFGGMLICIVLFFITESYFALISGTGYEKNVFITYFALILMESTTAFEIPLMIRLKSQSKVAAIFFAVSMIIMIPVLIAGHKFVQNLIGTEGGDDLQVIRETLQPYIDGFAVFLKIGFVPVFIILIIIGYKCTVHEMKRRRI